MTFFWRTFIFACARNYDIGILLGLQTWTLVGDKLSSVSPVVVGKGVGGGKNSLEEWNLQRLASRSSCSDSESNPNHGQARCLARLHMVSEWTAIHERIMNVDRSRIWTIKVLSINLGERVLCQNPSLQKSSHQAASEFQGSREEEFPRPKSRRLHVQALPDPCAWDGVQKNSVPLCVCYIVGWNFYIPALLQLRQYSRHQLHIESICSCKKLARDVTPKPGWSKL